MPYLAHKELLYSMAKSHVYIFGSSRDLKIGEWREGMYKRGRRRRVM
jgi:hypothetical protein